MDEATFFQGIKAGSLSGAYLLCGEEPYSRERAVEQVCAAVDGAARELNVQVLKNPPLEEAVNAAETLPFFAERRVVVLRELPADTASALSDYVGKAPDTTLLLIDQPGKPAAASPLYKAMKALDRVVEFLPFSPERAAAFAEKRAAALDSALGRAAGRMLVERLGTDLSALENGVGMLAGYVGPGGRITPAAVEKCIPPSPEYTVFHILDCLVAGNKHDGIMELSHLLKTGADTSMRLASFFEGRIKQMVTAKRLLETGQTEQQAIKSLGGSPYAAKKTVQNAKRCTLRRLTEALCAFASVDYQQKMGALKDDDALLLAILRNF